MKLYCKGLQIIELPMAFAVTLSLFGMVIHFHLLIFFQQQISLFKYHPLNV